jgi:hypothetical protein
MTAKKMKPDWSGRCSYCGKPGDAYGLLCYSASTGELLRIINAQERGRKVESRYQFCDAATHPCLERWLEARKGRGCRDEVA